MQADRPTVSSELNKISLDVVKTKSAIERYFGAFESGTLQDESIQNRVTELNLRVQQLEDERVNLEAQLGELELAELDQDMIRNYLRALEEALAGGINEQKKYLLRGLVEKAIAYDRGKYEIHYKLPDGTVLSNWLKKTTDGDVNSLSVNQLAPSVCNHEHVAPREGFEPPT